MADAGDDQSVNTGDTVMLDGSNSSDADGDDLKHAGKFYTPGFVVQHILDQTLGVRGADLASVRLLEPSCGTGDFLLAAYDRFAASYQRVGQERIAAHVLTLEKNLFALDSDPVAVALTRMWLALKCEEAIPEKAITCFRCGTKQPNGDNLIPIVFCDKCGEDYLARAMACHHCGHLNPRHPLVSGRASA